MMASPDGPTLSVPTITGSDFTHADVSGKSGVFVIERRSHSAVCRNRTTGLNRNAGAKIEAQHLHHGWPSLVSHNFHLPHFELAKARRH